MNDLMVSEFKGLNALKIMNCDEERRNDIQGPLYTKLKTRRILSRPNLEEKSGPLDQNPTVGCQEHNATQNT